MRRACYCTYVRTYLVKTDKHGGGEGKRQEVSQRVPIPELKEHKDPYCTTESARKKKKNSEKSTNRQISRKNGINVDK